MPSSCCISGKWNVQPLLNKCRKEWTFKVLIVKYFILLIFSIWKIQSPNSIVEHIRRYRKDVSSLILSGYVGALSFPGGSLNVWSTFRKFVGRNINYKKEKPLAFINVRNVKCPAMGKRTTYNKMWHNIYEILIVFLYLHVHETLLIWYSDWSWTLTLQYTHKSKVCLNSASLWSRLTSNSSAQPVLMPPPPEPQGLQVQLPWKNQAKTG